MRIATKLFHLILLNACLLSLITMSRYRPPAPKKSNYITLAGEQALRAELQQLWHEERPKVTAVVHEAAKNGDRSENGDYIYGKKRLREIDSRVRYLSKRLESVTVVKDKPCNQNKVFFGAKVFYEDENGSECHVQIVGPDEFDLKTHKISMDAPMAKALLGKNLDDEVLYQTPEGGKSLIITAIDYD